VSYAECQGVWSEYHSRSTTKKVLLIVLDGVGIGELPDAAVYRDQGSNTLGNTATAVGGLALPHLGLLGLGNIAPVLGVKPAPSPQACHGKMTEVSKGKDSTTGHWELMGIITQREFPTFPQGFPSELLETFMRVTGCAGFLGNKTASGTVIIQELGERHLETGFPIVYTSADSVFQIAAHEDVIPLERLYTLCRLTRTEVCVGEFAVSRVIARPFVGSQGNFIRTAHRRDFSLSPPAETLLDLMMASGKETVGVGKIDDLFAGRGITNSFHVKTNAEGVECILREFPKIASGMLLANLGDFDTVYGHRNDPQGFARALEEFDREVPRLKETLGPEDLFIITADHGNDPVTPSTDHSREYVPLLVWSKSLESGRALGTRTSFADVGKTIADFFALDNHLAGMSFRNEVYS
jgi:phosphopentomutase